MTTEATQAAPEPQEAPDMQEISEEVLGEALTLEEMMGGEKPEPAPAVEEKPDESPESKEEVEAAEESQEASEESTEEKAEESAEEVTGEDPTALFAEDVQYKIGENVYSGADLKKELGRIDKLRSRFSELGNINQQAIAKEKELSQRELEVEKRASEVEGQYQNMKDLFGGLDPSDPFTSLATLMVNVNPKEGLKQLKELKAGLRKEVLKEIGASEEDIKALGSPQDESFWVDMERKQLEDRSKALEAKQAQQQHIEAIRAQAGAYGVSLEDFKSMANEFDKVKQRINAGQANSIEEYNEYKQFESQSNEEKVKTLISACVGARISANAADIVTELVENTNTSGEASEEQREAYSKLVAHAYERHSQGHEMTKPEMKEYIKTNLEAKPDESKEEANKEEAPKDESKFSQVAEAPEEVKETDALSLQDFMSI
jgi:hypothetical protein